MPVIRIDDEVNEALKGRAVELGLVFGSQNDVLRHDYTGELSQQSRIPQSQPAVIEIPLMRRGALDYALIPVANAKRAFFPGFKVDFELETDIGVVVTRVTAAPRGTTIGDPKAGTYIRARLKPWFDHHPELIVGSVLRVEAIIPGKRYKLSTS